MIESTGADYKSSVYAKVMAASESKVGKTVFLVGSCLGVLPWQKFGGVVDTPENLHVITFDANALGGIQKFLTQTCAAKPEALKFRVYNMQDTMRKVSESNTDYDMSFYEEVLNVLDKINDRAKSGTSAVIFSSLTGLANGFERAIVGPPKGKGYSDPSKWKALAHQLHEIQNFAQVDNWHTFWECHIDKAKGLGVQNETPAKDTIRVSGEAGRNWGYNVEQIFRIRRQFGVTHPGTKVDLTYLDTKSSLDFVANGRGFTENLEQKEPDLTAAFGKLGLKVGHWGRSSKTK